MNAIQEKYNQLLQELTSYCKAHKIGYRLYGQTARMAYFAKGYIGSVIDTKIEMTVTQARKLIAAMEREPIDGRCLGYMGKQKYYPSFSLYYSDPGTLYLPLNRYGGSRRYAMGVEVVILRRVLKKPSNRVILANVEAGYEMSCGYPIAKPTGMSVMVRVALQCLYPLFGQERVAGWLFQWLMDKYKSGPKSRLCTRAIGKQPIVLPKTTGQKNGKLQFEGKTYPVAPLVRRYLIALYGKKWEKLLGERPGDNLIVDPNLSYAELEKVLDENGFSMREYDKEHKKVKKGVGKRAVYYRKKVSYWKKAVAVGETFEAEQYYAERHAYTRNLVKSHAFDKLETYLKPYEKCLKQKNGINFSPYLNHELMSTYITLLQVNGDAKKAAKYEKIRKKKGKQWAKAAKSYKPRTRETVRSELSVLALTEQEPLEDELAEREFAELDPEAREFAAQDLEEQVLAERDPEEQELAAQSPEEQEFAEQELPQETA